MADLIAQLKQQHQEMLGHFEAIKVANFKKDVISVELKKAKALILAHLSLEDSQLYSVLLKNPETSKTAEQFQARMGPITQDVLSFFGKHDTGKDVLPDFVRDVGVLLQKLQTRMKQEEDRLYTLFK